MDLNDTPSIEAGGKRQETNKILRNAWKKQVESEERLRFWKRMVGLNIGVREVENISEDIKERYRSERMKGGQSNRDIVKMIMGMKLRDEKSHQRELKKEKVRLRKILENECESRNQFKKIMSDNNNEAKYWRKNERNKFTKKQNHLMKIKEEDEIKKLEECPAELELYRSLSVFNKEKFEKMKKRGNRSKNCW